MRRRGGAAGPRGCALLPLVALALALPGAASVGEAPLTFATALEQAVAHNPELAAARRGRGVREAELRVAGQYPNPELSFEVARDVPHETLLLGVPLDVFGRRARSIDLAREQLRLADVEDRAALQKLRRELRLSFYGLLAAEHSAAVAGRVRDVAVRVRQVAMARVAEGVAPRLEQMQAELGVARAQADLGLAAAAERAARAELNVLLDRPGSDPIAVAGEIGEAPPLPDLARAIATALASNVDLVSVGHEASIEERRLGLLRAERLPVPVVSLGADFDAPGEFTAGARAGVSLALPLFSRNQGEIAGSRARAEQQRMRQRAVRRAVEARVIAALARAEAQREELAAYRDTLVPTAGRIEELAEESYRLGRTPLLAVLDAQRSLREVESEYYRSLTAFQSSIADLEDVLGDPLQ